MEQSIVTLHRYFIWADRMRVHYDNTLKNKKNDQNSFIESIMYMSMWYGMMYVVVEGWEKLGLKDQAIESVLSNKKNKDLLQKYRHGVFHFHENYYDSKFLNFYDERTTVEWIRNLRKEFSRWFLDYFKKSKTVNGHTSKVSQVAL